MEITDLMIGDWVKTKPNCGKIANGINPHIARVSEIRFSNSEGMYVSFIGINGRYYDNEIEPIPLTPEILEKNGFYDRSDGSKFNYVIHTNEYQISYYPKVNRFSIYKKGIDPFYDKDKFFCGFKNIVKYVHELQHALKMCDIEKTFVL